MSVHPRTPQTPLTVPPRVRCLFYHPSPLLKPPFRESTRNSYRSADEFEVLRILRGVLLTTDRLSFSLPLSVSLSLSLSLSRSLWPCFLDVCNRAFYLAISRRERSTRSSSRRREPMYRTTNRALLWFDRTRHRLIRRRVFLAKALL